MKTLITIEVENEIGNPSVEEVKSFVKQILEKGLVGNFDIYKYCPISGISLRVLSTEQSAKSKFTEHLEQASEMEPSRNPVIKNAGATQTSWGVE